MEYETLFLLGVYLLPLAFVSLVGAWASGRVPVLAMLLGAGAIGIFGYVHARRDEGLFDWREIPELTLMVIARLIALF
ncbi:hypothetical protein [Natronohydrobacter thiooxidans]|uniref:hypothetical protein n=1 Tax=Natronohydrobacter thiooxidans TaxID=87172 RepID=UPI0008FF329F|nr:hypothetical protein [Natronohydrobacter thiooxidans]